MERAQDWVSRHAGSLAGVVMAALMSVTFGYGIISWADAQTSRLAALSERVSALEAARHPVREALAQENNKLARIEQKLTDLSNFIKGVPPQ